MKKWISIFAVVLMILATGAAIIGCGGGDTEQAKEHMQNGDELIQELQSQANTWQSELTSSMTDIADPAKLEAAIEKAKSDADDLSEIAEEAKTEFAKIMGLSGVDDYKEYADLETQALDTFQEIIEKTNMFFDEMLTAATANDLTAITSLTNQYSEEAGTLGDEISELDEKAQQLKADKNL